jgi:hypothetical protein
VPLHVRVLLSLLCRASWRWGSNPWNMYSRGWNFRSEASSQIREFGLHFFLHRSNSEKKQPNSYRQTKIFGRPWRPEISRPDVEALTPNKQTKKSVSSWWGSNYSSFDHSYNVWRGVRIMKLFVTQLSLGSCFFVPPRPKCLLSTLFLNSYSWVPPSLWETSLYTCVE